MSKHEVSIHWQRKSEGFSYAEYNREHHWQFGSGDSLPASAAPEFLGTGRHTNPEEAFVASVASCHMLSFLAICARKRLVVECYQDGAVGYLEPNHKGKLHISRIELSPAITFGDPGPDESTLARLHELAHRECFIANSIVSEVILTRQS